MSGLMIALLVSMFATLIVMIVGVIFMARGGEVNKKYSNLLMQWRVILQGVSLLLLVLLFVL